MQEENIRSESDTSSQTETPPAGTSAQPRRRRAAGRDAGPPASADSGDEQPGDTAASTPPEQGSAQQASTKKSAATADTAEKAPAKKTAAKKPAAKQTAAKKTAKKSSATKTSAASQSEPASDSSTKAAASETNVAEGLNLVDPEQPTPVAGAGEASGGSDPETTESAKAAAPKKSTRKKSSTKKGTDAVGAALPGGDTQAGDTSPGDTSAATSASADDTGVLFQAPTFDKTPLFAAPDPAAAPAPKRSKPPKSSTDDPAGAAGTERTGDTKGADGSGDESAAEDAGNDDQDDSEGSPRRRRRRGGRGRRRKPDDGDGSDTDDTTDDHGGDESSAESGDPAGEQSGDDAHGDGDGDSDGDGGNRRRRRRRRRKSESESGDPRSDDPPNTVVKVRDNREGEGEVTSVKGSTRLEAKKQRRREGREAGRRRPPILTESEFLARREAVDRVMAVRQSGDLTQIGVLEDDVLVEHYVSRTSQQSLIGNVYLGRVQNVLPAMEAAFVDIGRGRNAVLYAGEVDWAGLGKGDGTKRIEDVLTSGQSVLVQVTKDPVGHKGARLTSQVSLPGRYVVYVPGGSMNGISRKLPDTERTRLKKILKEVVPEDAGVIVRTAAEGASEEELVNDVSRLRSQWEAIQKKSSGSAPVLLHGEPDLAIKVVRDLFNEDFTKLVVAGDRAWDTIDEYVTNVASSLRDRVERWTKPGDVFAAYRIDEQITKAMDRKVWLPSGGSLIIDRTEAMTVVDVNTGKFTGSGGNLEETVTKNNLEAAEEIVRQLRLRDIGGIIVIDFIDMVLEANRDLVLRRLVECLGRDRTKHQVAEVTSLGLVQMTRKRIGTGLLEAFSEACPHCKGRGLMVHTHPGGSASTPEANGNGGSGGSGRSGRSDKRSRKRKSDQSDKPSDQAPEKQSDKPSGQPSEKQPDKSAKTSDEPVTPKLEASASPGEASPADLMPAGGANGNGEQTGSGGDGETMPAKPAARSRRRAQRPAGRPEKDSSSAAESGGSSGEPIEATAQG